MGLFSQANVQELQGKLGQKTSELEALESSKGNVDQRYAEIVAARDQLKTELEAVSKERETLAKNIELSSAENKTITEEREALQKVRIFVSYLQFCSQFCVKKKPNS